MAKNWSKGLIHQSFVNLVLIIDKIIILELYAPLIAKKAFFRYLHGEHRIEYALSNYLGVTLWHEKKPKER